MVFLISMLTFSCGGHYSTGEIPFDQSKWAYKDGQDYPYRAPMLNEVVYNDAIRNLDKTKIIHLLGIPDREKEEYVYYLINQKRIGLWPLHSRFMVIKFKNDEEIEWIKIHE